MTSEIFDRDGSLWIRDGDAERQLDPTEVEAIRRRVLVRQVMGWLRNSGVVTCEPPEIAHAMGRDNRRSERAA